MCKNEEINNRTTLIHVKADGDNDTLHYIWDLTRQPTILVVLCEKNTTVTMNWTMTPISLDTIVFSPEPKYTMSFALTKVSSFAAIGSCFFRTLLDKLTRYLVNGILLYSICRKGFHV